MNKLKLSSLLELIEEVLDTQPANIKEAKVVGQKGARNVIPYPTIKLSAEWGTPGTQDRAAVDRLLAGIKDAAPKGIEGIKKRIQAVESIIVSCKQACKAQTSIGAALGEILILDAISSLVYEMNTSPGGRGELFESFLAALIGVEQIGQQRGLEDIKANISAKYMGSKNREGIKGSLGFFADKAAAVTDPGDTIGGEEGAPPAAAPAKAPKEISYIIAVGNEKTNNIKFYSYLLDRETAFKHKKGASFLIPVKVWAENNDPFAELNLESRDAMRAIATTYLDGLGSRLTEIYAHMNELANNLDNYFINGTGRSAVAAEKNLKDLQANVSKMAIVAPNQLPLPFK